MINLTLNEVIDFKEMLYNKYKIPLHFHDCCSGQHFSLDTPASDSVKSFISDFLKTKGFDAEFSEDSLSFFLRERTDKD